MKARGLIALGAAATMGLSALVGAGAAQAKASPVPTPQEVAHNLARMLTVKDVPKELMLDPGWEFTVKAHPGQHQALCDKNGEDVQGRATDLLYQVELGETNLVADPIALEQKMWPYSSTTEALTEWQYIQQEVRKCTGQSTWKNDKGGMNVQYLSWGYTNLQVRGNKGIWIYIDARSSGFNPDSEDGGYYILFPVGSAIQSVEYDFPDAKGLSTRKRQLLEQLSVTLANRWLDDK